MTEEIDTSEYPIWFFVGESTMHAIGAAFYVTRTPEKQFPARFDIWVSLFDSIKTSMRGCLLISAKSRERVIRSFMFLLMGVSFCIFGLCGFCYCSIVVFWVDVCNH